MPLSKKELRKELMLRRRSMDKSSKQKSDNLIHNKLIELIKCENYEKILCYLSINTEVETMQLIQEILLMGKAVYAPRCTDKDMRFIRIHDLSHLDKGAFGIPEPTGNEEITEFYGSVCIVPGLSFDLRGYRLGYGGGYYDRFLKKYTGTSVGICYSDFISEIPVDDLDVPVQYLITDLNCYDCGGKD